MPTFKLLSALTFILLFTGCDQVPKIDLTSHIKMGYHFDEPATIWEETLPLGNGRIGLMPDGGIENENYLLNEISMWSGSKQNTDNHEAYKSLAKIRELLFEGQNDDAQQLMYESFVCRGEGSGQGHGCDQPYGSYQLLGNLKLTHHYTTNNNETVRDYRRELNLEEALATVSFKKGETRYTREAFTSFSSDIAVIRLTADQQKALHFSINMDRPERYKVAVHNDQLVMLGRLYEGDLYTGQKKDTNDEAEKVFREGKGIQYGAQIRVILPKEGELTVANDSTLTIKDASEAILLISMATDYFGKDVENELSFLLTNAANQTYEALKTAHINAYQQLYNRAQVYFGHHNATEKMPINKRLEAFQQNQDDPSLMALYFQFGRYLLISSTRPGSLPPNLQGLWCNTIDTPWNGDYHLNINLQMNLWPAEVTNLSELHLPLIEWTKQQVKSGQQTARVFYNARGWVTHILGNVWEFTAPGEHPSWGATNTSAAWLCAHLYTHYLYTQDRTYLADVYPVMKEAALFFVDMLVEDPRSGYLVTAPTTSPENTYILPNGKKVNVCAGSTMDNQILRELFTNTIEAAKLLGIDDDFSVILSEKKARLMPTTIGTDGRIMEWLEPFGEAEPHHRHVSHLYGLHPACEISADRTPELAEAARKTLEARSDESTGWSMAWKVNFWARLHDGEHAFKLLRNLLKPSMQKGINMSQGGGTYPNLFCAHPPFQIDGNFGGCAGIAEMLVQSQNGYIEVLPALPAAWKTGHFSGLCVQGGGEIAAEWKEMNLLSITLNAKTDGTFRIKLPTNSSGLQLKINGSRASFPVINGMLTAEMKTNDKLVLSPL